MLTAKDYHDQITATDDIEELKLIVKKAEQSETEWRVEMEIQQKEYKAARDNYQTFIAGHHSNGCDYCNTNQSVLKAGQLKIGQILTGVVGK